MRVFAMLLITIVSVASGMPVPAAASGSGNGPVGWDVYRRLDRVAEIPAGVQTLQFSSFDRTGDNNDGFDGAYSCLRQTADGCVIAEAAGAGEVSAMWFTANIANPGHLGGLGKIVIELDGQRPVDMPLQDLVDGKRGEPFVFPLVANRQQSSGGSYIKVPMPFRQSMRITTQNRANFYHVTYRRFPDATGVRTFDPSDRATDVLAMLRAAGTRDPKPPQSGTSTSTTSTALAPGASKSMARLTGSGMISELSVRLPQAVGPVVQPQLVDDGRALKTGSTQFTVAVDPANQGVRLTRRLDTYWVNAQESNVFVDGVAAGRWTAVPTELTPRWTDVSLDLPASVTAGKSHITIRNEPLPSIFSGVQEFVYWVDSRVGGHLVRTDKLNVGPASVADETAHGYRITGQTWAGTTRTSYAPTGDPVAIAASDEVLAGLRLRVTFDGTTMVDAPLGEFFGSGLGEYPVRSLMFGMDTAVDGWYRSWWPMPFQQSAVVELVNGSGRQVTTAEVRVRWARTSGTPGHVGYFRATSRAGQVVPGQDWRMLDVSGHGRMVGVSHTMRGQRMDSLTQRGYLEGDERVHVDGSRTPQLYGTGSEDFYEAGWYFAFGNFSNPQNGSTAFESEEFGCALQCDSTYRLLIGDSVSFGSSLRFGMEHGHGNEWLAHYGTTTFWYGREGTIVTPTDVLDVGNPSSEQAHRFSAAGAGAPVTLTSVFEGDDDQVQFADHGRTATGAVSFRLAIQPGNSGVVLRRTSDQYNGYQSARVLVGGQDVGLWLQPLANRTQRWLQDSFVIPASATAGKSYLDIRLVPVAGVPAWHAAKYEALSILNPGS